MMKLFFASLHGIMDLAFLHTEREADGRLIGAVNVAVPRLPCIATDRASVSLGMMPTWQCRGV